RAFPDQLVAPVPAHVVEGPDPAVQVARHDEGGPEAGQLFREVAAGPRQLLETPDVEPRAPEDGLALELVERGRGRVVERDWPRAELRMVSGPRALRRLLEASHGFSSPLAGHRAGSARNRILMRREHYCKRRWA